MLNSLPQLDNDTIMCLDATSGAGQIPCDMSKVDLYFFSPQKIFASEGGLFVAIMSPKALRRAEEIANQKKRYIPVMMNWKKMIENGQKNQTYNTPALATLFLLNKQIEQMNTLGQKKVIEEAHNKAKLVYDWAEGKSYLSCYVKEKKYRSLSVATIDVDPNIEVAPILSELSEQKYV